MESLEWSEALEWACDHLGHFSTLVMQGGSETFACMDTFVNQHTQKKGETNGSCGCEPISGDAQINDSKALVLMSFLGIA